ncbi:MAG: hypothetical protein AB7W16_14895 [Candidatus Obscuribacterales bacterium]
MMELANVNDGSKNNEVFGQAGGLVTREDWDRYNDKLIAGRKSDKLDPGGKLGPSDYLDLPDPFDNPDDKIRMNKKEKALSNLKGPKCIDFDGSDSGSDTESSEGSHSQDYRNEQLGNGPSKDDSKKVVEGGIKDSVNDNDVFDADRSRSVKPDIGSEGRPGPTFDPGKTESRLDGGEKAEILLDINHSSSQSVRPAPILTQPFTVNRDGTISRGTTRSAPLGK